MDLEFTRWAAGLAVAGVLAAAPVHAEGMAGTVAAGFAERLATALEGSPEDQDRLWDPAARDSSRRMLDIRTASLFQWTDVSVRVESAAARESGAVVDAVLLVTGTATWNPQAYGVAQAFWQLQADEENEVNRVVRREAWRLDRTSRGWRAAERQPLAPVEVVSLDLSAGVYPGQDALLVECTYYFRALADGVETCRFLLDSRANIYSLLVDGQPAELRRGGELGALGLEGFSSETESSLRFPRALNAGEEVLVKLKIWAPLVHMRGEGFITTFPIHQGPFQERVWYPVPFAAWPAGPESRTADTTLRVRFPAGALVPMEADAPPAADTADALLEEEVRVYRRPAHFRDLDFFLLEPGVDIEGADWSAYEFSRFPLGRASFLPSLTGNGDETAASLDPHPRSRRAVVEPLLREKSYSTQDLSSELDELLPLDLDAFDELFDDSAADADQGAGEPDRD